MFVRVPVGGGQLVGHGAGPAQAAGAAHGRGQGAQAAGGQLQLGGQVAPVGQTARLHQAGGQQVARQVEQLGGAELPAQELHAGFVELVGFVKHDDAHAGQQLGHAVFTDGQVGKEQVVVDDHDVRRQRLPAGVLHVAGLCENSGQILQKESEY